MKCFEKITPQALMQNAVGFGSGVEVVIESGVMAGLSGVVISDGYGDNVVKVKVKVFGVDCEATICRACIRMSDTVKARDGFSFPFDNAEIVGRLIGLIIQENGAAMPFDDLHDALVQCANKFDGVTRECLTAEMLAAGDVECLSDGKVEVYSYKPWGLAVEEAAARSIISILREMPRYPKNRNLRGQMSLCSIITKYTGYVFTCTKANEKQEDKRMRDFKNTMMKKVLQLSPCVEAKGDGYRALD